MNKEKRRKITDERLGKRLGKYLKDHKIGQGQLLDLASKEDDYDEKLQQSNLSEIIRGKGRYLSEKAADIFSRVLEIDPGYLKGEDGYKAATYEDYLIGYVMQDKLKQDFHKYDGILSLAGAKAQIVYDDNYNVVTYLVNKDGHHAEITAEDMDNEMARFYEDICKYASKRFAPLMDLYASKAAPPMSAKVEHGPLSDEDKEEVR